MQVNISIAVILLCCSALLLFSAKDFNKKVWQPRNFIINALTMGIFLAVNAIVYLLVCWLLLGAPDTWETMRESLSRQKLPTVGVTAAFIAMVHFKGGTFSLPFPSPLDPFAKLQVYDVLINLLESFFRRSKGIFQRIKSQLCDVDPDKLYSHLEELQGNLKLQNKPIEQERIVRFNRRFVELTKTVIELKKLGENIDSCSGNKNSANCQEIHDGIKRLEDFRRSIVLDHLDYLMSLVNREIDLDLFFGLVDIQTGNQPDRSEGRHKRWIACGLFGGLFIGVALVIFLKDTKNALTWIMTSMIAMSVAPAVFDLMGKRVQSFISMGTAGILAGGLGYLCFATAFTFIPSTANHLSFAKVWQGMFYGASLGISIYLGALVKKRHGKNLPCATAIALSGGGFFFLIALLIRSTGVITITDSPTEPLLLFTVGCMASPLMAWGLKMIDDTPQESGAPQTSPPAPAT